MSNQPIDAVEKKAGIARPTLANLLLIQMRTDKLVIHNRDL